VIIGDDLTGQDKHSIFMHESMTIYTTVHEAAPAFRAAIDGAQRLLLLSHINPDGDAIGSLLGVYHSLRALGKTPIALASSAVPSYTLNLPDAHELLVYQPGGSLPPADLIWLMDTAALARVGRIFHEHEATLTRNPLLIVDHHVTNIGEGRLNLIDPHAASCAELLFRLLRAMDVPVPPQAATCLLMGMTSDTQSFQTSSTNAQSLRSYADLMDAGADHAAVIRAMYFTLPASTVRLSALALSTMHVEDGLLWSTISQAMLAETGAEDEAGDDVVQRMQRVVGMRACVLFKERRDGTVKISLRSTPTLNVALIAQRWGGGGHAQAAGATLEMGLAVAYAEVLPVLRAALA
jgi:phosphoesterase RecJ-like protein